MIKVAICNDKNVITSQIETIILYICDRNGIPVDTDVFCDGESLEKEILQGVRYDLIYLNIQMENREGIATAKNIRKADENVLLIYVSEHEAYMSELFRLAVFAFIRKPIDFEIFEEIFLDANRKICNQKFYFSFHYKSEDYKIPSIDILYFESNGRKINVHIRDGSTETFNGKLSEVEMRMEDGKIPFIRVHQSYLVNYHHIRSCSKTEITLVDGTKLPISEDRKKHFRGQYHKLMEGNGK